MNHCCKLNINNDYLDIQSTVLHHPMTDMAQDWADEENEYWNWSQLQQIIIKL